MITDTILPALLGVLTWSFLEYVLHRWISHDRRFGWTGLAREHTRHHVERGYFSPTWQKVLFAGALAVIFGAPVTLVFGDAVGLAYAGGLVGFYGAYEVCHRLNHVTGGVGPYARWARRHHFHHHFGDVRTNHGVTSPLWDILLGTYRPVKAVHVPRRLAMPWLLDPATGEIRARHAATFRLRRSEA